MSELVEKLDKILRTLNDGLCELSWDKTQEAYLLLKEFRDMFPASLAAERKRAVSSSPNEALNSGDGTYKP